MTNACKGWQTSGEGNTEITDQGGEGAIVRWTPIRRSGQKRPLEERPESEDESEDDVEPEEIRPSGVDSANGNPAQIEENEEEDEAGWRNGTRVVVVDERTTCVDSEGRSEPEADNLGTEITPCSTIMLVSQGGRGTRATGNMNHTTHLSKKTQPKG